jgi:2'-5' RNA ligase
MNTAPQAMPPPAGDAPFCRVFAAIALDDTIKARLADAQPDVAWVYPGNLHLSVVFLGDMPAHTLETVCRLVGETACATESFMMPVGGVGTFGATLSPRVIWAGVPALPVLERIHHSLATAFAAHGWQSDSRAYRPHITLGRVRSGRGRAALAGNVEKLQTMDFGAMTVTALTLFRSVLKSGRAHYTALFEAPLTA